WGGRGKGRRGSVERRKRRGGGDRGPPRGKVRWACADRPGIVDGVRRHRNELTVQHCGPRQLPPRRRTIKTTSSATGRQTQRHNNGEQGRHDRRGDSRTTLDRSPSPPQPEIVQGQLPAGNQRPRPHLRPKTKRSPT